MLLGTGRAWDLLCAAKPVPMPSPRERRRCHPHAQGATVLNLGVWGELGGFLCNGRCRGVFLALGREPHRSGTDGVELTYQIFLGMLAMDVGL